MAVPDEVLDLFAVPADLTPIPGGVSVRAGDLVLSPGRDPQVQEWLSPVLARLAVRLDEQPGRARDLRVAMPVPARDGSWVVRGWAAGRWEPGTVACHDLDLVLAAGRLLHARLDVAVRERPGVLVGRQDRWAVAERAAFGPPGAMPDHDVVRRVRPLLEDRPLGPDQLVHVALAGRVLLDARGAPVVIDVTPAWRPVLWAEALCVLDSVIRYDAPPGAVDRWRTGPDRQAMLLALIFRALGDTSTPVSPYEPVLSALGG